MDIPADSKICPCCGLKISNTSIKSTFENIDKSNKINSDKKCKYCAMKIPSAAKICPYCHKKTGMSWPVKALIAILFIGAISTMIEGNRRSNKSTDYSPYETKTNVQTNANNDHTTQAQIEIIDISIDQLNDEYAANEVAADQKYKNKNIHLSGAIRNISKDAFDNPYVNIATSKYSKEIRVTFPRKIYDNFLAEQKIGNHIDVTGICKGLLLGKIMIDVK
jgi:hypothetical protein